MLLSLLLTIIILTIVIAMIFRQKSSLKMSAKIADHFVFNNQTKEIEQITYLYQSNQVSEALKKTRDMIIHDTRNLYYHYILGCMLMDEAKYNEAIKQFEIILEFMPDQIEPREKLIECFYLSEDYKKTINECESFIKIYDESATFLYKEILADSYFKEEQNEKSIQTYIRLLSENTANLDYLNKLSILFLRQNEPDKTLEIDKRILTVNNFHTEAIVRTADILFEQKEYKQALDLYERLSQANPQYYEENLLKLALCYFYLNKMMDAKRIITGILRKNSENIEAHYLMSEIYKKVNSYERAIESAKETIGLARDEEELDKNKKNVSSLLLEYGKQWLEKDQPEISFDYYLEALKYNPESAEVYYALAMNSQYVKDYSKAIAMVKKALSIEKKAKYYLMLGYLYDEENNPILARKSFEDALRLDEHNIEAMSFLGIFYAQEKKYERAIDLFSKVLENDKNNQDAYYNIALCYEYLDNKNKAYKYYKKLLEINPQHQGAQNNISVLE